MAPVLPKAVLPPTVTELLSMARDPSENTDPSTVTFTSVHVPAPMGHAPIGFGGCTLGMAATAACSTLETHQSHFRAYSLLGNFMGPTLVDRKLKCLVRKVRDTKTFATRMVEVKQRAGKVDLVTKEGVGKERICLLMTVDFQAPEKESEMVFSASPRRQWGKPEDEKTIIQVRDEYATQGMLKNVTPRPEDAYPLSFEYYDARFGLDSPLGQSLMGVARRQVPLPQQDLPHAERTSVDWLRCTCPVGKTQKEMLGSLVFPIDFATSFIPLAHDGRWLGDLDASSSLEFALRIFRNEYDMTEWHITEKSSAVAAEGRAYTENKIWDSTGTKLLAIMSQQAIMRPKSNAGPKI